MVPYQYAAKSRPPAAPTAGAAGGVPGEEREREAAPARQFSEVEDRFLVCLTAAIGYGAQAGPQPNRFALFPPISQPPKVLWWGGSNRVFPPW